MIKKKKIKNIETIRISDASLAAFKSNLLKELIKQNIYFNDETKTTYLSLEELPKDQVALQTLFSVEGRIIVTPDDVSRKKMLLGKRKALLNAASLDFQMAYDLSPIPTGTERGIANVQVARNKNGKIVLVMNNRPFVFKK